jgi:hypothetical protein
MKSLETTTETNLIVPVQRNSVEVPARIAELIERRDKAIAEAAMFQRMIDMEAVRLEKEAMKKERWEAKDWTTQYTGQKGHILSAIWHAPKRRLSMEKVELAGWGKKKKFVPYNTFKSALARIRRKLKEDKCPYILMSIRSCKTGEVIGYGLRKRKCMQKMQK